MKILIDAGHGIDTPGKRSPNGVFREYYWNREIAEKLLALLENSRYDAEILVPETNDIALRTRVNRVNSVCSDEGKDNVMVISIHSNAAGNGEKWMNAKGWSCYTSKGKTESDKIAECMYDAFEEAFPDKSIRKDMQDGDRDWEENFYLLQKTKCPAVLLENFFYDNKEECFWLLKEETKDRIANAILKGISNYYGKRYY